MISYCEINLCLENYRFLNCFAGGYNYSFLSRFGVNFSLLFLGKKIEWGLKQISHLSLL